MKTWMLVGLLAATPLAAQTPMPPPSAAIPPDTVIATVGDQKVRAAELEAFLRVAGQRGRQTLSSNPQQFVQQLVMMQKLAEQAAADKLDEKTPYREQLAYYRNYVLSQARIQDYFETLPVAAEDQKGYYERHQDRYQQVRLKVIYLSFVTNPEASSKDGRKARSEAEAKARAVELVQQIRGGADFVALAKLHSDDAESKARDADYGTIRRSDRIPEPIAQVIFQLKAGDVSEPVRHVNGFYIFRAEEVSRQPFEQVRNEIFIALKQEKQKAWFEALQNSLPVKIENEAFFQNPPAAPGMSK